MCQEYTTTLTVEYILQVLNCKIKKFEDSQKKHETTSVKSLFNNENKAMVKFLCENHLSEQIYMTIEGS